MIRTIQLKKIIESNGSVLPVYLKKFKDFNIKRFFIIEGKKNDVRGDHAHKKCTQIFIPINGSVKINIFKKNNSVKKLYSKKPYALVVPPMHWVKIKFISKFSSVLTLCNFKYDENEYIREFNQFLKLLNKK